MTTTNTHPVSAIAYVSLLPEVGESVYRRLDAARAKARRAEELRAEAARLDSEILGDVAALNEYVEANWTAAEIASAKSAQ